MRRMCPVSPRRSRRFCTNRAERNRRRGISRLFDSIFLDESNGAARWVHRKSPPCARYQCRLERPASPDAFNATRKDRDATSIRRVAACGQALNLGGPEDEKSTRSSRTIHVPDSAVGNIVERQTTPGSRASTTCDSRYYAELSEIAEGQGRGRHWLKTCQSPQCL